MKWKWLLIALAVGVAQCAKPTAHPRVHVDSSHSSEDSTSETEAPNRRQVRSPQEDFSFDAAAEPAPTVLAAPVAAPAAPVVPQQVLGQVVNGSGDAIANIVQLSGQTNLCLIDVSGQVVAQMQNSSAAGGQFIGLDGSLYANLEIRNNIPMIFDAAGGALRFVGESSGLLQFFGGAGKVVVNGLQAIGSLVSQAVGGITGVAGNVLKAGQSIVLQTANVTLDAAGGIIVNKIQLDAAIINSILSMGVQGFKVIPDTAGNIFINGVKVFDGITKTVITMVDAAPNKVLDFATKFNQFISSISGGIEDSLRIVLTQVVNIGSSYTINGIPFNFTDIGIQANGVDLPTEISEAVKKVSPGAVQVSADAAGHVFANGIQIYNVATQTAPAVVVPAVNTLSQSIPSTIESAAAALKSSFENLCKIVSQQALTPGSAITSNGIPVVLASDGSLTVKGEPLSSDVMAAISPNGSASGNASIDISTDLGGSIMANGVIVYDSIVDLVPSVVRTSQQKLEDFVLYGVNKLSKIVSSSPVAPGTSTTINGVKLDISLALGVTINGVPVPQQILAAVQSAKVSAPTLSKDLGGSIYVNGIKVFDSLTNSVVSLVPNVLGFASTLLQKTADNLIAIVDTFTLTAGGSSIVNAIPIDVDASGNISLNGTDLPVDVMSQITAAGKGATDVVFTSDRGGSIFANGIEIYDSIRDEIATGVTDIVHPLASLVTSGIDNLSTVVTTQPLSPGANVKVNGMDIAFSVDGSITLNGVALPIDLITAIIKLGTGSDITITADVGGNIFINGIQIFNSFTNTLSTGVAGAISQITAKLFSIAPQQVATMIQAPATIANSVISVVNSGPKLLAPLTSNTAPAVQALPALTGSFRGLTLAPLSFGSQASVSSMPAISSPSATVNAITKPSGAGIGGMFGGALNLFGGALSGAVGAAVNVAENFAGSVLKTGQSLVLNGMKFLTDAAGDMFVNGVKLGGDLGATLSSQIQNGSVKITSDSTGNMFVNGMKIFDGLTKTMITTVGNVVGAAANILGSAVKLGEAIVIADCKFKLDLAGNIFINGMQVAGDVARVLAPIAQAGALHVTPDASGNLFANGFQIFNAANNSVVDTVGAPVDADISAGQATYANGVKIVTDATGSVFVNGQQIVGALGATLAKQAPTGFKITSTSGGDIQINGQPVVKVDMFGNIVSSAGNLFANFVGSAANAVSSLVKAGEEVAFGATKLKVDTSGVISVNGVKLAGDIAANLAPSALNGSLSVVPDSAGNLFINGIKVFDGVTKVVSSAAAAVADAAITLAGNILKAGEAIVIADVNFKLDLAGNIFVNGVQLAGDVARALAPAAAKGSLQLVPDAAGNVFANGFKVFDGAAKAVVSTVGSAFNQTIAAGGTTFVNGIKIVTDAAGSVFINGRQIAGALGATLAKSAAQGYKIAVSPDGAVKINGELAVKVDGFGNIISTAGNILASAAGAAVNIFGGVIKAGETLVYNDINLKIDMTGAILVNGAKLSGDILKVLGPQAQNGTIQVAFDSVGNVFMNDIKVFDGVTKTVQTALSSALSTATNIAQSAVALGTQLVVADVNFKLDLAGRLFVNGAQITGAVYDAIAPQIKAGSVQVVPDNFGNIFVNGVKVFDGVTKSVQTSVSSVLGAAANIVGNVVSAGEQISVGGFPFKIEANGNIMLNGQPIGGDVAAALAPQLQAGPLQVISNANGDILVNGIKIFDGVAKKIVSVIGGAAAGVAGAATGAIGSVLKLGSALNFGGINIQFDASGAILLNGVKLSGDVYAALLPQIKSGNVQVFADAAGNIFMNGFKIFDAIAGRIVTTVGGAFSLMLKLGQSTFVNGIPIAIGADGAISVNGRALSGDIALKLSAQASAGFKIDVDVNGNIFINGIQVFVGSLRSGLLGSLTYSPISTLAAGQTINGLSGAAGGLTLGGVSSSGLSGFSLGSAATGLQLPSLSGARTGMTLPSLTNSFQGAGAMLSPIRVG